MLKQLKAFAGPGITLLVGLGLPMIWPSNPCLGWFFIGLSAFWLVISLFRNKRLVRRFPGIVEWLPFLEEDEFSPAKELSANFIQGRTFRIIDILQGAAVLRNRTFEDCTIVGPALIAPKGAFLITDCIFESYTGATMAIELDPKQEMLLVGAVALENCVLKRCTFRSLLFIGSKGFPARLGEDLGITLTAYDSKIYVVSKPPSLTPSMATSQHLPAS